MDATTGKAGPIVNNAPQVLKDRSQWVCWRYGADADSRPRKVPYDSRTGRKASSTDPSTWATFEQAVQTYAATDFYDGVGFVFTEGDPLCGIDLDDCINGAGKLADWAREVVETFNTYTEVSPSESGVKLYFRGCKPGFAQCSCADIPGGADEPDVLRRRI